MKVIPLTQGKFAKVSDRDYPALSRFPWYAMKSDHRFYAVRKQGGKHVQMHRVVLGLPSGRNPLVDHRDGDGLNNQRRNLRPASNPENARNRVNRRGNFRGVYWDSYHQKFRARIEVAGKRIHLGYYDLQVVAVAIYDKAAKQFFGEFASLNFPKANK